MSTETLLCDPVLRHGWDGMFNIAICDIILKLQIVTGLVDAPKSGAKLQRISDICK